MPTNNGSSGSGSSGSGSSGSGSSGSGSSGSGSSGGGGFDVFGLVSGIGSFAGDIIGAVANCEGNCWTTYPPFSGKGSQREMCLLRCRQAGAPVTYNQGGGGISTSGLLTAAALGLGLFVVLDKPKKGRRR